jgi:hypothetical protein
VSAPVTGAAASPVNVARMSVTMILLLALAKPSAVAIVASVAAAVRERLFSRTAQPQ